MGFEISDAQGTMTESENELETQHLELQAATDAAVAAGKLLLAAHPGRAKEKSVGNLVTEADLESERIIVDRIRAHFPGHSILSEESSADIDVDSANLWIIDPLDGTNNFAHGIPQFCVSIAYAQAGHVRMGVVYDPNRDELFTCVHGESAKLNGHPIAISNRDQLSQSIVCTGFYYDRSEMMRRTLKAIESLFDRGVQGVRRFGSAALDLCWVACGRLDGYFEYQLGTWDFAAGSLLVQSAGGHCTDRNGQTVTLKSQGMIASNGRIHSQLLQRVKW